ncbi:MULTISPECIES: hypothetical protein [unclassified Streptomyces]|uniref:hypothetical protein n=1 Tax=unclassified Streptomyces TaxID=2593676 RepID=UPI00225031D7|nr:MULTISPECIES: hypothetical protein [unclassified Streptomyces]MCX5440219.1 hypothetical protein [Streptomyces sp. NBC_00063]WSE17731.1 hypothetical protein OG518_32755 [Streptomyces sp. NBC_01397]WUB93375.1 hypothetical protein OHO83_14285 [Streptomyces sp. NBC_00569]
MTPEPVPFLEVGDAVHDTVRDRFGRVMGHEGPYLRIRPLAGGREWDADPGHLRLLTQDELLRALVAEANARSRQGI